MGEPIHVATRTANPSLLARQVCFSTMPSDMILGLGMDISEVARIKASLDRFGDSFLKRILHPQEITYCQSYRNPAQYVAVRFAAKEAISKALGTGIGAQLGWHDMEIC